LTGEKGIAMEDSTAKGLKEARKRRERIAKVKAVIIGVVVICLFLSVAICWFLAWKMYSITEAPPKPLSW